MKKINTISHGFLSPQIEKNKIFISDYLDLALPLINHEHTRKLVYKIGNAKYNLKLKKTISCVKPKKRRLKNLPPPTPYNTTEYICKNQSFTRTRGLTSCDEDLVLPHFDLEHPDATMIGTNDKYRKEYGNLPFNNETLIFKDSNTNNLENSIFDLMVNNSFSLSL